MKHWIGLGCHLRQFQRMRQKRHSQAPFNRMWRGKSNVGSNKNNNCKKVAHVSIAHPWRMAAAPSLPPMAPSTPSRGTVGAITVCDLPDTPPPKPDAARLNGLFAETKWKFNQLPNRQNRVSNFLTVLDSPYEETSVWKHTWMSIGIVSIWARQPVRSPPSWLNI